MLVNYTPSTPVDAVRLWELLRDYTDRVTVEYLYKGFTEGFKLHYEGPKRPRDCNNLKSARENPTAFVEKVNKEIALGRYIGPFAYRPIKNLQCSPLGLVEKKGNQGKWRLIMHLSYPRGDSINTYIPKEHATVKYKSFDSVIQLCVTHGQYCNMAKADVDSAFKNLPMNRKSLQYLGIQIGSKYLVETCLPFGSSESCAIFERFVTALDWIVENISGQKISHYLDDFIFIQKTRDQCQDLLDLFLPDLPGHKLTNSNRKNGRSHHSHHIPGASNRFSTTAHPNSSCQSGRYSNQNTTAAESKED